MLKFYGCSDDLAEVDGDVSGELSPSGDYGVVAKVGTKNGGCYVRLQYNSLENNGCWDVTVGRLDEDIPIPWPIKIEMGNRMAERGSDGYTAMAIIECPPGTPVVWKSYPENGWEKPQ